MVLGLETNGMLLYLGSPKRAECSRNLGFAAAQTQELQEALLRCEQLQQSGNPDYVQECMVMQQKNSANRNSANSTECHADPRIQKHVHAASYA